MLFNQQTLGLSRHQLLPTVCLKMPPPLPPPEMASTPRTKRREGWHLSRPGFLLFLVRNKMAECFGFQETQSENRSRKQKRASSLKGYFTPYECER